MLDRSLGRHWLSDSFLGPVQLWGGTRWPMRTGLNAPTRFQTAASTETTSDHCVRACHSCSSGMVACSNVPPSGGESILNLATERLDSVEETDQSRPLADVCSAGSIVLHTQTEVRIFGVGRYRHLGSA